MTIQRTGVFSAVAAMILLAASCSSVRETAVPAPSGADPLMGDWTGHQVARNGEVTPVAVSFVEYGGGSFEATIQRSFEERSPSRIVLPLERRGDQLISYDEPSFKATVRQDIVSGEVPGQGIASFEVRKVLRTSPTMGARPPAGATILFNGTGLDAWENAGSFAALLDFAKLLGGNDRVAYGKAEISAPSAMDAVLQVGSDDGVKVWLNGTMVHGKNVSRGVSPGEDKVKVRFSAGMNTLLAKVNQGDGGWALCARFVDGSGNPIPGVADSAGWVMRWYMTGPYSLTGAKGENLFDRAFPPEDPGAANVAWKQVDLGRSDTRAGWKIAGDAMEVAGGSGSIVTKKKFSDFLLHLEFCTPFMPAARGQARGNSGVYLQGRYEIQVLDSYGLVGEDNECGGIYQVARPRVNMCAPPGQWQTYDISFRAARFDASGAKIETARVTVRHNGVTIHELLALPGPTGGALDTDERLPGGLSLQDHGNPVRYRNVWIVEK